MHDAKHRHDQFQVSSLERTAGELTHACLDVIPGLRMCAGRRRQRGFELELAPGLLLVVAGSGHAQDALLEQRAQQRRDALPRPGPAPDRRLSGAESRGPRKFLGESEQFPAHRS
jgi:hypothetical protein